DAADCFLKVAELKPDYPETYDRLAFVFREEDRVDDSIVSKGKALELRSASQAANERLRQLGRLLFELDRFPVIYKASPEIEQYRNNYASRLNEVRRLVSDQELNAEERDILKKILFRLNSFYLGYQNRNDRDHLVSYSRLATAILSPEIQDFL